MIDLTKMYSHMHGQTLIKNMKKPQNSDFIHLNFEYRFGFKMPF